MQVSRAPDSTIRRRRPLAARLAGVLALLAPAALCVAQPSKTPTSSKPATTQPTTTTPAVEPAALAPSGKSLVIPDALKALGQAYHAQPGGMHYQMTFRSDAPFEKIAGHSSGIVGFAIAGPESAPAKLQGGEWRLPVESLKTGDSSRDTKLSQAGWFDAAKFPNILFRLKDVRDIKPLAGADEPSIRAYTATLVGDMTMHGVTHEVTIADATIRFRAKSAQSSVLADGDLLFISYKNTLKLSEYGITNPEITTAKKVADQIEVNFRLMLASIPPEDQTARPVTVPPVVPRPGAAPKQPDTPSKDAPKH